MKIKNPSIILDAVEGYTLDKKVKIALYAAESCIHLTNSLEARHCIRLVKLWLDDNESVLEQDLEHSAGNITDPSSYAANVYAAKSARAAAKLIAKRKNYYLLSAVRYSEIALVKDDNEYLEYIKLVNTPKDSNFPYKEMAKRFDLDNPVDLNVFLDFLIDNYPTALIYSRKEYLTKRICKEHLKILYQ